MTSHSRNDVGLFVVSKRLVIEKGLTDCKGLS